MDHNQKAAIIALIIVVILILAAIGLLVYQIQTAGLPSISLPQISFPPWSHPGQTPPGTFQPFATPSISTPEIIMPSFAVPSVPMPRVTKPPLSPSPVMPPPELRYDTISFGSYEQGNGREPIEWLVLERKDDRCLLISRYALDILKYHGTEEPVTWETSGLREWLNSVFLDLAFSSEERAAVLVTEVDNSVGYPIFDIDGGNNTEDHVFLLSLEEAEVYFPTEEDRLCQPTKATKSAAVAGYSYWWLRSPGYKQSYASYINCNGAFLSGNADRKFTAIRPVIWVASDSLPTV